MMRNEGSVKRYDDVSGSHLLRARSLRLDESTTHCSGLNCSRIRPDRNNLGIPSNPATLAQRLVSSHSTNLSNTSNRDDWTISCLGRHSRQDGQRKQDPTNFSTSARSRILGLPIPEEPGRVCPCHIFDGALLL